MGKYMPNDPRQVIIDGFSKVPRLQKELEHAYERHHGTNSLDKGTKEVRDKYLNTALQNPNDKEVKNILDALHYICTNLDRGMI